MDRRRFSALSYLTHYYDDHDDIEVYEDIFVVKILSFNATYMVVLQMHVVESWYLEMANAKVWRTRE